MLVLTRKLMETLHIGNDIHVTVVRLSDGQVRLGIDAPREVSIVRGELRTRDAMTRKPPVGAVERTGGLPITHGRASVLENDIQRHARFE